MTRACSARAVQIVVIGQCWWSLVAPMNCVQSVCYPIVIPFVHLSGFSGLVGAPLMGDDCKALHHISWTTNIADFARMLHGARDAGALAYLDRRARTVAQISEQKEGLGVHQA